MPLPRIVLCTLTLNLAVAAQAWRWSSSTPPTPHEVLSLAAADLDADGDPDLVIGSIGFNAVWRNDGDGKFTSLPPEKHPIRVKDTQSVLLRDFDGDGDVDVFLGNGGWLGGEDFIWINRGDMSFADNDGRVPPSYAWTNGCVAGDFDGDGDIDVVVSRFNQTQRLVNDGDARFELSAEGLPAHKAPTVALASGDVDGDGDPDLVLGNALYTQNRLWLNLGAGVFEDATDTHMPKDQADTNALALADLDGDGDLDLLCGNGRQGGEQPSLYLNDGKGHFVDATAERLPELRVELHAVVATDLDNDGDLDLVLGTTDGLRGAPDFALRNDGSGRFARFDPPIMPPDERRTSAILAVDFDGDGRTELVMGDSREGGRPVLVRVRASAPESASSSGSRSR